MPETTRSGRSSIMPVSAMCTQSVGVPLTKRKPFWAPSVAWNTDSGRCSVSELEAPLWFCSGATTVMRPSGASARWSAARPGAR